MMKCEKCNKELSKFEEELSYTRYSYKLCENCEKEAGELLRKFVNCEGEVKNG